MSTLFSELGLEPQLVEAVGAAGYESPTPIQARAIPLLLSGRDLIGQAQTGTGKTAAYGLPMLQKIQPNGPLQALVLTPTRELAIQVCEQLNLWSKKVRSLAVYGGQPIPVQFKALKQGVQVVVATPGRLIDHLERGSLTLDQLKLCVLDEADEMLDFGFEEELETILTQVPKNCQMALFSATFPAKITQLAGRHLKQPARVEIETTQRTVGTIEQFYCLVRPGKKARSLGRLLDHQEPGPSLVFCRTRLDTQQLTEELRRRGYPAECLHGDMDQSERERVMDRFRQNQCQILVATDIAARGLDVEGITHVFNYDIPWDVEHYIHRVGRTARAGRSGVAITVIEPSQQRQLQRIERESGASFKAYPVPTKDQIMAGRRKRFAERMRAHLEDPRALDQIPLARSLARDVDPLAVAAAALEALWQSSYAPLEEEDGEDLAPALRQWLWVSLSVGRQNGLRPAELLRLIQEETGLGKGDVDKFHILDDHTLVEFPSDRAERALLDLRRVRVKGKRIRVDFAAPPTAVPVSKERGPGAGRKSRTPARGKPSTEVAPPRPGGKGKNRDSRGWVGQAGKPPSKKGKK